MADHHVALNRGDRAAMLASLVEDVAHDLDQPRETGKPAFAAFMARMDASYRERRKDIAVMASADGMRAAAEYVVHGVCHHSGAGLPEARGQACVL